MREPQPGVPRPLCCCWLVSDGARDGGVSVSPSDLRLLCRAPPMTMLNLSNSPAVTDEWLEALAAHHAGSLRALDLSGCAALSASSRPLRALQRLTALEALRLPAERWDEHEIAEAL